MRASSNFLSPMSKVSSVSALEPHFLTSGRQPRAMAKACTVWSLMDSPDQQLKGGLLMLGIGVFFFMAPVGSIVSQDGKF